MACVSPVSPPRGMMPEVQNPAQVQGFDPLCWVGKICRLMGEAPGSLAHSCPLQALGHCSGLGAQWAGPGDTGRSVPTESSSQPTRLAGRRPEAQWRPAHTKAHTTTQVSREKPFGAPQKPKPSFLPLLGCHRKVSGPSRTDT